MNIILIGIPGSGKSTLSERFKNTHCILNPDSFRKKLWGSESYQGPWGEILMEMVAKSMAEPDKPILIDATCLHKAKRKELLTYFAAKTQRFGWTAIWFDCALDVALDRNSKRARKVPEHVIERMHGMLEVPGQDEGYETIIHWGAVDNKVISTVSSNPVLQLLGER